MRASSGKYTVPDEIRALRPMNLELPTTVKNVKGHFYVYFRIRVPDPNKPGKLKNASGKCIGKIEGGKFIPSQGRGSEDLRYMDVEMKDYGEYAIALKCSEDVLEQLEGTFGTEDARRIYAIAIIWFIDSYTPSSYIKDIFDDSILSNKWPTLSFSENTIDEFLINLGRHSTTCEKFSQGLIDHSSGLTAIDAHVILSCSRQNDLADYGNKYRKIGNKQVNILEAFDVENNHPLTSKAFAGGVPDKSAVQELFETYQFRNTTFIVDMGFYSEENVGLYRANGNHFVIPLSENLAVSKAMRTTVQFTGSFQYEKQSENGQIESVTILYLESTMSELEDIAQTLLDDDIRRKNEESIASCPKGVKPKKYYHRKITRTNYGQDRVIMYRDEQMHEALSREFQEQIGQDNEHTQERYEELEPYFGLILLRTEKDGTAKEIYITYKKRWRIETYYNHVKNDTEIEGTHSQDYYSMQGTAFIQMIEGLIYSRFMKQLQGNTSTYINRMSKRECLTKAAHVKMSKHQDGKWYRTTDTKRTDMIMVAMGIDVEEDQRKLNTNVF